MQPNLYPFLHLGKGAKREAESVDVVKFMTASSHSYIYVLIVFLRTPSFFAVEFSSKGALIRRA
jgi:hypothetical protein